MRISSDVGNDRCGDDGTDVARGPTGGGGLDEGADGDVDQPLGAGPGFVGDVNDVFWLQGEIDGAGLENLADVDDEGLRMIERAADDEDAIEIGVGREAAAHGGDADDGGIGGETLDAG